MEGIRYKADNPGIKPKQEEIDKDEYGCSWPFIGNFVESLIAEITVSTNFCDKSFEERIYQKYSYPTAVVLEQLKGIYYKPEYCNTELGKYKDQLDNFVVTTYDDGYIDIAIHRHSEQLDKQTHDQKFIVHFNGNMGTYISHINELVELSDKVGFNFLVFDYSGTGRSEGRKPYAKYDLITDGIAVINYLHSHEGAKHENLFLYGNSMGGAVSIKVAKYFYDQGAPIAGVFAARTFSDITKVIPEELKYMGLPDIMTDWADCAMREIHWDMRVDEDYKALPDISKTYFYVRENHISKDNAITHEASLHISVDRVSELYNKCKNGHELSVGEHLVLMDHYKKYSLPTCSDTNWHRESVNKLVTAQAHKFDVEYTVADYFVEFVERVIKIQNGEELELTGCDPELLSHIEAELA